MGFNDLIDELSNLLAEPAADGSALISPSHMSGGRPTCFIVDDEPGIRSFIAGALRSQDLAIEEFSNAKDLLAAVAKRPPQIIFLDISLERSDAVEAIRGLANLKYKGVTQLMSGRNSSLLDDVRQIGERHSLSMLPTLQKPFRAEAVRRTVLQYTARASAPGSVSLDQALREGWMRVWYQPKIDLQNKRLIGVESLARVEHPENGIMLPGSFLPGASDEALSRLTEFMLTKTLADWTVFADAGCLLTPAINVPANVLYQLPIAAIAREHWPKTNTSHGLILEVTEDQIMRDIEAAHEVATQLKIYDITLAIDDFGAGYSSFARLKSLPFSELKLDRSFVKDCSTNADNCAICQMAIDLAHRFGSQAVAEGIETPADLRTLHRMGCDIGQGFLLAVPMPRDRLLAIVDQKTVVDDKQNVVAFPLNRSA